MSGSSLFITCVIGLCLVLAVIVCTAVGGGSFGARCERMHPTDPIAAERCIFDLSHGQRP